ncbi:MAG: hypothetical protein Roseis2KO_55420 [Roseivirga sp.]
MLSPALSLHLKSQSPTSTQTLEQAQALYDNKAYDNSLQLLQAVITQTENQQNWTGLVKAHLLAGKNHNRKREYPQRLEAATEALRIVKGFLSASDSLLPVVLREKGDSYIRLNQYDSSVHYLKQARERFTEMENWDQASSCGVGIGSAFYRKKAYPQAERALLESQKLMEQKLSPLPSLYGTVLNLLGAVYRGTGDYEKALQNSLNAVRFHENNPSSGQRLTFAYNNLGTAYFNRADYNKAEEVLLLAEINAQKGEKPDYRSLSNIYNNLMLALTRKKQYERALAYGQQRQKLLTDKQVQLSAGSMANFYNNLALVFLEMNRQAESKAYFHKAYLLDTGRPQTLANLGYYYLRSGQTDSARTFLKKAIAKPGDNRTRDLPKLYRYLGEATMAMGDQEQGLTHFNTAISLLAEDFPTSSAYAVPSLESVRQKRELLLVLSNKGKQMAIAGAPLKNINETLLSAVALADSLYQDHLAEGSRLFLRSEAIPLYEATIRSLLAEYEATENQALLPPLFEVFEKGKSSLLTDLMRVKNANLLGGVPAELIEQESTLQIDIAFYESELYRARQKVDSTKASLYNGYRLEKINELDRLKENFRANYPKYYLARHAQDKLNLNEVQEKLKDSGELLVEYFVGENAVYAMAISADDVVVKEISEPVISLRSETVRYLSTINDPTLLQTDSKLAFQRLSHQGQQLYQKLITPLFAELKENPEALYIVPDGFLNYLPFEALITGNSGNSPDFIGLPYLIKKYPVRYSYSASLPQAASGKKLGKSRVLGMAPFSDANLPNSGDEIAEINKHFSASLLPGNTGTKAEFRNQANGFEVLHLATHGTIDTDNPGQSYLSFAADSTDGKLHVYELENMDLSAKLAILSACETGTGNFVAGEGVMSLARGFTYAGVPSVLMSLWKVDDRSGTDLISGFYKGLSAEANKARALQTAKLNYLDNADQLHAHPYFWSQFVLVGDPAPLKSVPAWPLWVTLAGLILLGGLVLATKRAQKAEVQ